MPCLGLMTLRPVEHHRQVGSCAAFYGVPNRELEGYFTDGCRAGLKEHEACDGDLLNE